MATPESEGYLELQRRIADLTSRVYRLEQRLGMAPAGVPPSSSPSSPQSEVKVTPPSRPPAPAIPSVHPPANFGDVKPPPPEWQSLESRIGSQWLNRIGIFAILIGAAYFLKLAFDNQWIGPSGRVMIGMAAGIALVFWSTRLHARGYQYFSYSLTATGVAIMYLSLWAAFQLYRLVPAPLAFVLMVVVTLSAAVLALRQDAMIIAVVALSGGFATPGLLSTGENHPYILFSYIAMLDLGAIALVTVRPWRRLLSGAFLGTVIYYAGWSSSFYDHTQRNVALLFATLFLLIFALLPVWKLMRPGFAGQPGWAQSKTFILVALLNPVAYFLTLLSIFEGEPQWRTIMAGAAILLGALYIVIGRSAAAVDGETRSAGGQLQSWLHLGIAIGFLTIAIPLRLEGHWITFGWLAEAAVLLWVGNKLAHHFLISLGVFALGLAILRLLALDSYTVSRLIFNQRMLAYAVAVAILAALARALRRESKMGEAYVVTTVLLNALALLALSAEGADFWNRGFAAALAQNPNTASFHDTRIARDFTFSAIWMIYGAALLAVGFLRSSPVLRWEALVLVAFTVAKVFIYDLSALSGGLRVLSFMGLGVLLLAISFVYQKDWLKLAGRK